MGGCYFFFKLESFISSGPDAFQLATFSRFLLLYSHLLIHAEIYVYMLDTYRCNNN